MNGEGSSPKNCCDDSEKGSRVTQSPGDVSQSGGDVVGNTSEIMAKLLTANWGGSLGKAVTVEELLDIGRKALEPLFHEPPLGPIPEYLKPHASLHGCVAEYEEKIAQLEQWKVQQLSLWLEDRVGKKYRARGAIYRLQMAGEGSDATDTYLFELMET
jgi:hypothetical protein